MPEELKDSYLSWDVRFRICKNAKSIYTHTHTYIFILYTVIYFFFAFSIVMNEILPKCRYQCI